MGNIWIIFESIFCNPVFFPNHGKKQSQITFYTCSGDQQLIPENRFLQINQSVSAPGFWKSANEGRTHSNGHTPTCQPINNRFTVVTMLLQMMSTHYTSESLPNPEFYVSPKSYLNQPFVVLSKDCLTCLSIARKFQLYLFISYIG